MNEEIRLNSRSIYQGKVISLQVDQVSLPNGKQAARELVVHPGAVCVLAVDDQERVLLVQQYRYAASQELWELPAGKLEPGEEPEPAALRELAEETGFTADQLQLLYTLYTAPGFCNERLLLYQARRLRPQTATPDDDEFITSQWFTRPELAELLQTGEIRDGKTLVGLLHFLSH